MICNYCSKKCYGKVGKSGSCGWFESVIEKLNKEIEKLKRKQTVFGYKKEINND